MYNGAKILALIPARGGSKGIKGKNIIPLADKPLIAYSIEAALRSKYLDRVVVTTDSVKIAEVAEKFGADVPFIRPDELARDESKTIDAVLHAINFLKSAGESYDIIVLLQPTQPLRTNEDIDGSIVEYFTRGRKSLVSVSLVDDHPLLIRSIDDRGNLVSLLKVSSTCRRQDMPNYYRVNGCIYINDIKELNKETSFNDNSIPYIMKRSHSVDIDDLVDLHLAEYYIKNSK